MTLQHFLQQGIENLHRAAPAATEAGVQRRQGWVDSHQAWLERRYSQALSRPRATQNAALVSQEAILN